MNKNIETLLLNFKRLTKVEPKLTEEEIQKFERVSYNKTYQSLLDIEGFDAEKILIASILNRMPIAKALNPFSGELIYERKYGTSRINLISLGYKIKKKRNGNEIYVKMKQDRS